MSTATHSDSIASDQVLESVGKASLAGVCAVLLAIVLVSWNPTGLAFGSADLSGLGVGDPAFWFVVGPLFAAAAGSTVLLRNVIESRTRWVPTSPIDVSHLFASVGIVAVYLLTSLVSSSMDVASPDELLVAVLVLGVVSAVSESVVSRWLRLPGKKRVLAIAFVLLLGIAVPTGIGAAIDDTDQTAQSDGDLDEPVFPEFGSPAPEDRTEVSGVESQISAPSNVTDYEPAEVQPVRGEIGERPLVKGDATLRKFLILTDQSLENSTVLRMRAWHLSEESSFDSTDYRLRSHDDGLEITAYDEPGDVFIFVDVVEDGRIIRYQRTIDLSELE